MRNMYHRTIPFNSNEDRICVAFDLKPMQSLSAFIMCALGWLSLALAETAEFVFAESYILI